MENVDFNDQGLAVEEIFQLGLIDAAERHAKASLDKHQKEVVLWSKRVQEFQLFRGRRLNQRSHPADINRSGGGPAAFNMNNPVKDFTNEIVL